MLEMETLYGEMPYFIHVKTEMVLPVPTKAFLISVQKWPFSNSALLHLHLLSFGANFCYPATTVAEVFLCTRENSTPLLPQQQNVSHQINILLLCLPQQQNVSHQGNVLLFCYDNCRTFLTRKYSALLLPQQQNVSHQRQNSVLVFPQKYSAVLIPQ